MKKISDKSYKMYNEFLKKKDADKKDKRKEKDKKISKPDKNVVIDKEDGLDEVKVDEGDYGEDDFMWVYVFCSEAILDLDLE